MRVAVSMLAGALLLMSSCTLETLEPGEFRCASNGCSVSGTDDGGVSPGADAGAPSSDAGIEPTSDGGVISQTGSCAEFASPSPVLSAYPVFILANLTGRGADVSVTQGRCAEENVFDFREPRGEDQVVQLTGLTPDEIYWVELQSDFDAMFYVATGCEPTSQGPSEDQCLIVVDESTLRPEAASFRAPPSGTAFVIIDEFTVSAADREYRLDVYPQGCGGDSDCMSPQAPYCLNGDCAECKNEFHCIESKPLCGLLGQCEAGPSECINDDRSEDGDDGPAGARLMSTATAGNPSTLTGHICSVARESDWIAYDHSGGSVSVRIDWQEMVDIDLEVYNSSGLIVASDSRAGFDPIEKSLPGLPMDTYYLSLQRFGSTGSPTATTEYTVMITALP